MKPDRDALAVIKSLRADGAVEVEVDGIRARWPGPPAPEKEALEPAAALEYEARRAKARNRTLEERLFKPLGIKRPA